MIRFGKVSRQAVNQLSPAQLRVYAMLCTYRNSDGEAWPRVSTMARDLKLSARRVNQVLTSLDKSGWVERRTIHDDHTRWLVHLDPDEAVTQEGELPTQEGELPNQEGELPACGKVGFPNQEGELPLTAIAPTIRTDKEQTIRESMSKLRPMALRGEPIDPLRFRQLALECWAKATGRQPNRVKLTAPRKKLIDEGRSLYGTDGVIKACEGIALSDFHMGRERGQPAKHDSLEVALRLKPRNNLELFAHLWDEKGGPGQAKAISEGLNGAPLVITSAPGWVQEARQAMTDGWELAELLARQPTPTELQEVQNG